MTKITEKTKRILNSKNEFEGLSTNFLFFEPENDVETRENIENLSYSGGKLDIKTINMLKKQSLSDVFKEIPAKNTSYHLISNGTYDFFTFVPVLIDLLGGLCNEFYGSTWTMNRNNVNIMFELFDSGKLKKITILTGTYFKRRESAVYATLLNGIMERKQRYLCFENHSKIALLSNVENENYITVEGSANFTANPRVEQYVITNHKGLFEFHKNWMDKFINGK